MGTHLRVLSESYPMSTNMTGFEWLSTIFTFLYFGQVVSAWGGLEFGLILNTIMDNGIFFAVIWLGVLEPNAD